MEPRIGFEPTTYALRMRAYYFYMKATQAIGGTGIFSLSFSLQYISPASENIGSIILIEGGEDTLNVIPLNFFYPTVRIVRK